MKPVYETCVPRDEVLEGRLQEDIFAAKLGDVIRGEAPEVYSDPALFFQNTYPTGGLKTFLREVFGRLGAGDGSPFLRLETSFGGGKTHNLIAAYHVATSGSSIPGLDTYIPSDAIPDQTVNVAALVGQELDPNNGVQHGDVTTYTLWGEMAYQLGGAEGYELVKKSDTQFGAPGTDALSRVIGDSPTVVMIDEIANHLRVAKNVPGLRGQISPFLGALMELAGSRPNLVVVLTLAQAQDAYGRESEEVRESLREMSGLSARRERTLTPTGDEEIASVITHRLFDAVDREAAAKSADAFRRYYEKLLDQGVAVPTHAVTPEYANDIEQTYPLHPSLIDVLNRKTSTIPNFQRTRGALRLLAQVVRNVWDRQESDAYLISPANVDLSVDSLREELTSRLDRQQYTPVITADIWSEKGEANPSHAQQIDADWESKGKPPLGRRVAQTIFLHSLTHGKAKWATRADINLAVCQPGLDADLVTQTIDRLDSFWHIHTDEQRERFYFDTEPSPAKIIDEEMDKVGRTEGKKKLGLWVRSVYKTQFLDPVIFPEGPEEVDDGAGRPKLALMNFDSVQVSGEDDPPPSLVRKIHERTGGQGKYRTYQNNVLFLCVSEQESDHMLRAARRHCALERITDSDERMKEFDESVRKKLTNSADTAQLKLRQAVTRGYQHLFYPSGSASTESGGLEHYAFRPQEGGTDAKRDIEKDLIKVLRQLNKVLTADDDALGPLYVEDKLWPDSRDHMSTEELRRAFCKKRSMPIILAPDKLKETIRRGIEEGNWVYWDGQRGYGPDHPLPSIALVEDHTLYLPDSAPFCLQCGQQPCVCADEEDEEDMTEACPLCGQDPCVCGTGEDGSSFVSLGPLDGTPNKVFTDLEDRCKDGEVSQLSGIRIACDDVDTLRRLGLAFSQLSGLNLNVEHSYTAQAGNDSVKLTYSGSWEGFEPTRDFTQKFEKRADDREQRTRIHVRFERPVDPEGAELERMLESFNSMEIGKVELTGSAAEDDEEDVDGQ